MASSQSYTLDMATFASRLKYSDLPSDVVATTRNSLMDFCGVSLYVARNTPWGQTVARLALREGASAERSATVIGHGKGAIPSRAALANGTMGLGFEYEDAYRGITHINPVVISAALAASEWRGQVAGKELIAAVVAGHEIAAHATIACREGDSATIVQRGLYPVRVFGGFGAAAAAGHILGLDAISMARALGLAGEEAGGTMQSHREGAWSRRLHGGNAAQSGVTAALLAAEGFAGPSQIFEGADGIYHALGLNGVPERLTDGLGTEWEMRKTWYKPYPTAGGFHCALDILQRLCKRQGIRAEDVEHVTCSIPTFNPMFARKDFPTVTAAQYSAAFALAAMLTKGKVSPAEYTEDSLHDRDIIDFALSRVTVTPDEELQRKREQLHTIPSRLTVRLKDGSVLTESQDFPRGHPMNPMTTADIQRKFQDLVAPLLTASHMDALSEALVGVDQLSDVATVAKLLAS